MTDESNAPLTRQQKLAAKMAKASAAKKFSTVENSNDGLQNMLSVVDGIETSPGVFLDVSVSTITKLQNPREVPCSLDDVKSVDWPSIDEDHEDQLGTLISHALDAAALPFWTKADDTQKAKIISFFEEIHTLAISLKENSQIQNIVVHRDGSRSSKAILIAGERRVFAALYSKGQIPMLQAKVYNKLLTPLQVAKITDQENTNKPLTAYEKLVSKLAIFDQVPDAKKLKTVQLQRLLGVGASDVSLIKRVAVASNRDALLAYFHESGAGWRTVAQVVSSGIIPSIGTVEKFSTVENIQPADAPATTEPKESAAPKEPVAQEVRQMLKKAGKFGFKLKSSTNLGVAQLLLQSFKKNKDLPSSIREDISSLDLEDPESLLRAFALVADYVEAQM